jgi:hypothetical protein
LYILRWLILKIPECFQVEVLKSAIIRIALAKAMSFDDVLVSY